MLGLLSRKRQKTAIDDLESSFERRQRRQKIDRYLELRRDRVKAHEAILGLHPQVVFAKGYDRSQPAYDKHQRLKCTNDPEYCRHIPVLFVYSRRTIAVEIDGGQVEYEKGWDRMSSYGYAQLKELLGPEACEVIYEQRKWYTPYRDFFGNYFFPIRHYAAAIRLTNFAARRDQFPDFKYWFAVEQPVS